MSIFRINESNLSKLKRETIMSIFRINESNLSKLKCEQSLASLFSLLYNFVTFFDIGKEYKVAFKKAIQNETVIGLIIK
jgi:hypothetical protein